MKSKPRDPLYSRVRDILESARSHVARSVNTTQVIANWLIGQEIVQEEQGGEGRAEYGRRLLESLSKKLKRNFGTGFSVPNLRFIRQFYLNYPRLLIQSDGSLEHENDIRYAARSESKKPLSKHHTDIRYALRSELDLVEISATARRKPWKPGLLHSNLSWTHYRTLLRVEDPDARSFYEIESIEGAWSARELERQINSLFYERIALSKDKKGLKRLAKKGHEILKPADIFKDPMVIEFLGMPASPRLMESDLETALIDHLQSFLLELGKGFAFVSRQERITLDGDHFHIDLVFYHTHLKCYILIDLKVGKLTHQDLGQLQLYVNYYDRERLSVGDHPTLGLILCTDKNDAVVKYTLADDQTAKIFASRYKLHVPTVAMLRAEMRRELRTIRSVTASR